MWLDTYNLLLPNICTLHKKQTLLTSGSAIISCNLAGLLIKPIGPPGPLMRSWNAFMTFGFFMPSAMSGSDINPAIIPYLAYVMAEMCKVR